MASNVKLLGVERMRRTFRKLRGRALQGDIARGLFIEGERIMSDSKKQVPVDTGALRSTGHVQPPDFSGPSVSVTLGYGGPAAGYAIVVHEDLQARHTVGNALYLERPFLDALPGAQRRLGVTIRGSLRNSLRGTIRTL